MKKNETGGWKNQRFPKVIEAYIVIYAWILQYIYVA